MGEEQTTQTTAVTRRKDKGKDGPLMSYTAVTSHQEMAVAFLKELIVTGQQMMPDHDLSIEDLVTICHVAVDERQAGVVMLEGRHLRGRIGEQISRANRYEEPFSLLVLNLDDVDDPNVYDSIVDTLAERMRKTDLMFLFKHRIVLILPHTEKDAVDKLSVRIQALLEETVATRPHVDFAHLTYPSEDFEKPAHVLDWAEDALRSFG